jgi:hypothetical protein
MTRSQWVIRLLEIVLASKASNIKAPSDPKEAYKAIIVYLDACQTVKLR